MQKSLLRLHVRDLAEDIVAENRLQRGGKVTHGIIYTGNLRIPVCYLVNVLVRDHTLNFLAI